MCTYVRACVRANDAITGKADISGQYVVRSNESTFRKNTQSQMIVALFASTSGLRRFQVTSLRVILLILILVRVPHSPLDQHDVTKKRTFPDTNKNHRDSLPSLDPKHVTVPSWSCQRVSPQYDEPI